MTHRPIIFPSSAMVALCPECQSDVNSNKRGCGTYAQAHSSARVDVPTARVFPAWTTESNMSASFSTNAWTRARRATDHDPALGGNLDHL